MNAQALPPVHCPDHAAFDIDCLGCFEELAKLPGTSAHCADHEEFDGDCLECGDALLTARGYSFDKQPLNPEGLAHVEALIDTYGLPAFLNTVSALCVERAERARVHHPGAAGAQWGMAAFLISSMAAKLARVQL